MTTRAFLLSTKTVVLGMAVAQSIPLLGSLVIARLFAPAEFGQFSAWLGLVMTAAVVVTGRLEMALGVEPDGEPRKFAMVAVLVTVVGVCSALTFVVFASFWLVPLLRGVEYGLILLFVPVTFLAAAMQTWQQWAAAEGLYRKLSNIRIAQALGVTGFQILIGWLCPGSVSLAIGQVLGLLIGICVAAYLMPMPQRYIFPWPQFWLRLRAFWFSHRRFPMFALPADFINTASGQIPLLMIAGKFGLEASGLFALTARVVGAPIGLLGAAVLDVFKRTAASSYRERGHCEEEYARTFKVLVILGILLAAGIMLVAENLFVVAFGEPWRHAGTIAVWLMPMFAMRFVASPLSYVFYIAGKQKVDLLWQCALMLLTLGAFTLLNDFESSVKAYGFGYATLYVVYLILSYRYSKGKSI